MLAAAPATAVQLTHACLAAGYEAVVPASWGDELVAARVLERAKETPGPALQCSCPLVAARLSAHGETIRDMVICTVAPVAAAAEYLRALYAPARPAIAFAGACAAGASDVIDTWMSPDELFTAFATRGISLRDQPTEFDTLPPDRRRFHSEPGGLPGRASLRQLDPARVGIEVHDSDFIMSVGQHLLGDEPVLLDVSVALGCACAGAAAGGAPAGARARVREHEPPRAPSPVVDHRIRVVLDATLPRPNGAAVMASTTAGAAVVGSSTSRLPAADTGNPPEPPRRRSPAGLPRPVFGTAPRNSRTDGRTLPRAYVARRRSSPRGVRRQEAGRDPAGVPFRVRLAWIGGGLIAGAVLVLLVLLAF